MMHPLTIHIVTRDSAARKEIQRHYVVQTRHPRWEMVKTVVVPSVRGGVVAAIMLGLGRALGEAIAVTQVIGNFIPLQRSIFEPGDTIASRLANQYQGAITNIQVSALIYLGLILLVITFVTNYAAQRIVKRFDAQRAGGG